MSEIVVGEQGRPIFEAMRDGDWYPARTVAEESGVSKTLAHRYLTKYTESGHVERDREAGKYGADLFRLTQKGQEATVFTRREQALRSPCTRFISPSGYVFARNNLDGHQENAPMHRLLAVAEYGFEAIKNRDIHHKNGIPWDNRPSNIEPKPRLEHINDHWHGEPLSARLEKATDDEVAHALRKAGYEPLAEVLREDA